MAIVHLPFRHQTALSIPRGAFFSHKAKNPRPHIWRTRASLSFASWCHHHSSSCSRMRPHAVQQRENLSTSAKPPRVNGRDPKSGYSSRSRGSPPGSGLSSGRATTALAACAPLSEHCFLGPGCSPRCFVEYLLATNYSMACQELSIALRAKAQASRHDCSSVLASSSV